MRKLLTATLATLFCLALVAAPASAKRAYTYTATIDCGQGPVVVGSYDNLWAHLEDTATGRRYKPVEWHVQVGDRRFDIVKPGVGRQRVACSYDDGEATGTVVVRRDQHFDAG